MWIINFSFKIRVRKSVRTRSAVHPQYSAPCELAVYPRPTVCWPTRSYLYYVQVRVSSEQGKNTL